MEVHVKTIPQNYGALETRLSIQDIEVEDVLDREKIIPDKKLLEKNIFKKYSCNWGWGFNWIRNIYASSKPKS